MVERALRARFPQGSKVNRLRTLSSAVLLRYFPLTFPSPHRLNETEVSPRQVGSEHLAMISFLAESFQRELDLVANKRQRADETSDDSSRPGNDLKKGLWLRTPLKSPLSKGGRLRSAVVLLLHSGTKNCEKSRTTTRTTTTRTQSYQSASVWKLEEL
jgi:hypothetical protein